jgi:hypothetical protein
MKSVPGTLSPEVKSRSTEWSLSDTVPTKTCYVLLIVSAYDACSSILFDLIIPIKLLSARH